MFKSKSILVAALDAFIAVVSILVVRFAPQEKELVLGLLAAIQPLMLAIILHYATEPIRALLMSRHSKP